MSPWTPNCRASAKQDWNNCRTRMKEQRHMSESGAKRKWRYCNTLFNSTKLFQFKPVMGWSFQLEDCFCILLISERNLPNLLMLQLGASFKTTIFRIMKSAIEIHSVMNCHCQEKKFVIHATGATRLTRQIRINKFDCINKDCLSTRSIGFLSKSNENKNALLQFVNYFQLLWNSSNIRHICIAIS